MAVAVSLSVPGPAAAYLCDGPRPAVAPPHPELVAPSDYASPNDAECRVPDDDPSTGRTKKRGSMSGLTVFVLAVAAMLLIPIGRLGVPRTADPYRDDENF